MIMVQRCRNCGRRYFPARLLCAECDDMDFTTVELARARVETSTVVHVGQAARLVTLADDDLVLIGALHGEAEPGDHVPLHSRPVPGDGPIAVVPGTEPASPEHALRKESSR